jgi:hypothetical protein
MCPSYGTVSSERSPEPNDSPFCPRCGRPLRLMRVEPIRGCEEHTVQCPECGREEIILVTEPARAMT